MVFKERSFYCSVKQHIHTASTNGAKYENDTKEFTEISHFKVLTDYYLHKMLSLFSVYNAANVPLME